MGFLERDLLLKKQKLQIEKVLLDGGDYVFVRELTARERDDYEISLLPDEEGGDRDMEDFRARIAVRGLCDKEGKSILEVKDYKKLSISLSGNRMKTIVAAINKLNKLAMGDDNEIVKNSEAAQSGNSISGSVES